MDKGWVTEASVEDVKLLPGVRRTMFGWRAATGWPARWSKKSSGQADFILSTGDLVWWGKQGGKPSDNPYWTLVNKDVLKQLPPPEEPEARPVSMGACFPRSAIMKCGTTPTYKAC